MQTATTTKGGLDPSTLGVSVRRRLTHAALYAAVHGRSSVLTAQSVEADKRKQARALRELAAAGWIAYAGQSDYSGEAQYVVPEQAAQALEVAPSGLPPADRNRPEPFAVVSDVYYGSEGYGSERHGTAEMLWRVRRPSAARWAVCQDTHRGARWPIPLASDRPIAEQVAEVRQGLTAIGENHMLVLMVSDDAIVLRHQQGRARALWEQHRGRTKLALARFGGTKDDDDVDESDVEEIPDFYVTRLFSRLAGEYDPARSWEDDAQAKLREADEAIVRAHAVRAALLKRYTTVAIANPGPRPYDAMRARYEQWIAEYIIRETGVDPRTLP